MRQKLDMAYEEPWLSLRASPGEALDMIQALPPDTHEIVRKFQIMAEHGVAVSRSADVLEHNPLDTHPAVPPQTG